MTSDRTNSEAAARPGGHWLWHARGVQTSIRVVGRGPETRLTRVLPLLAGAPRRVAHLRQIHSSTVIEAAEGLSGEADALFTDRTELAMVVATADCLPIVLSSPRRSAVIHAGWRGLEAGILHQTLDHLVQPGAAIAAWIGPGIGVCCYEVGLDVALRVARHSSSRVMVRQDSGAVHLDLLQAARDQLSAAGVGEIDCLSLCTYCQAEKLWSYRREGPGAGRNWTFAWRYS